MDIFVCIGSSCHLKGSYDIINLLKESVSSHNLEDRVNLKASFCLGHCTDGVTMKVNDTLVTGVNTENFDEKFATHVLEVLGR